MIIGILKETAPDNRVAIVPESGDFFIKNKVDQVWLEKGAGDLAFHPDSVYQAKNIQLKDRESILAESDLICCIRCTAQDCAKMKKGTVLIGQFNPLQDHAFIKAAAASGIMVFSLDVIPRTTRAQAMDVLSSMATLSGYKAVLTAALHLPHIFPMFMTAAGSIKPAKVLVLGAGVAGLQAIATAKRLGAVVEAFDVRTAAKEEVLSLGAKFVEVEGAKDDVSAGGYAVEQTEEFRQKQTAKVQEHAMKSDVVICTAQIPGRKAPVLITEDTVHKMVMGSIVIDLAASTGGNCAATKNNEIIRVNGVTVIGDSNLAMTISADASKMFAKNVTNFLQLILKDGQINLNFDDDIVAGTCCTKNGEIVHERILKSMQ
jgi:NAD(P) transhydrogenase subunit alpha